MQSYIRHLKWELCPVPRWKSAGSWFQSLAAAVGGPRLLPASHELESIRNAMMGDHSLKQVVGGKFNIDGQAQLKETCRIFRGSSRVSLAAA